MHCNKLISPGNYFDNSFSRAVKFFAAGLCRFSLILAAMVLISSCTSSNLGDGLRPNSTLGNQNTPVQNAEQQNAPSEVALLPGEDGLNSGLRPSPGVIFLPVVGPPQFAVTSLSSAVKRMARANAITIIPNGQAGATYQVKGYFSALDDGSGTILVFIWDILNGSGKTVHRISGEERTTLRKSDPWAAVDTDMIDNIVERSMQNFRDWMNTRSG